MHCCIESGTHPAGHTILIEPAGPQRKENHNVGAPIKNWAFENKSKKTKKCTKKNAKKPDKNRVFGLKGTQKLTTAEVPKSKKPYFYRIIRTKNLRQQKCSSTTAEVFSLKSLIFTALLSKNGTTAEVAREIMNLATPAVVKYWRQAIFWWMTIHKKRLHPVEKWLFST